MCVCACVCCVCDCVCMCACDYGVHVCVTMLCVCVLVLAYVHSVISSASIHGCKLILLVKQKEPGIMRAKHNSDAICKVTVHILQSVIKYWANFRLAD